MELQWRRFIYFLNLTFMGSFYEEWFYPALMVLFIMKTLKTIIYTMRWATSSIEKCYCTDVTMNVIVPILVWYDYRSWNNGFNMDYGIIDCNNKTSIVFFFSIFNPRSHQLIANLWPRLMINPAKEKYWQTMLKIKVMKIIKVMQDRL